MGWSTHDYITFNNKKYFISITREEDTITDDEIFDGQ
jgi:hypothetical protein